MACTRCFGSFSRQLRKNVPSTGGMSFGSTLQSGSMAMTWARVFDTSSPTNGLVPVSISKSTTPYAQTSARLSTTLPLACSGAM